MLFPYIPFTPQYDRILSEGIFINNLSIFVQPLRNNATVQVARFVSELRDRFAKAPNLLETAHEDILTPMHFPKHLWQRIQSTNSLKRLNRDLKRRFNVLAIFPHRSAVIRLERTTQLEHQEEWINGRWYLETKPTKTM